MPTGGAVGGAPPASRNSSLDRSQSSRGGGDVFIDALSVQPPVICPLLCFLVAKRGSIAGNELKALLYAYYPNEQICHAKDIPRIKRKRTSRIFSLSLIFLMNND